MSRFNQAAVARFARRMERKRAACLFPAVAVPVKARHVSCICAGFACF